MKRRWFLGLVATLVLYLGLSFWFGIANVMRSLAALPWWCWVVVPALVALGYLLLFQRWQFYLRQLGHPLPWPPSSRIYAAGLSLVAAPGRSGEALRGLWLQRRHGTPLAVGVGITLAERLTDLAAALLVLSWGLGGRVLPAVGVGLLLAGSGAWLFTHPIALAKLERGLERLPAHRLLKGPIRLLREGLDGMARLRSLLRPWPLLLGTTMASMAWLLEATLLHGLFTAMGSPIDLAQAAVVRTATALGGVLSVLPAGLGTSELTSIGLAVAFGASRPVALATTLILRLVTVVLPSLVGSLILVRHRPGVHNPEARSH
jgi:uncharacterized membrane protein YbhN (UPF0104 family)